MRRASKLLPQDFSVTRLLGKRLLELNRFTHHLVLEPDRQDHRILALITNLGACQHRECEDIARQLHQCFQARTAPRHD